MVLAWFNKPQTGKCMEYEDLSGVSYTKLETSKLETVGFGGTTWDNQLNLDFVNLLGIHLKSTFELVRIRLGQVKVNVQQQLSFSTCWLVGSGG